jgi:flagellar basal-body rod modification protein FlgD
MASVSSLTAAQQSAADVATQGNDLRGLNMDDFLDLMITELQNQDPMDPTDSSELLQQIGLIREIGATNELSETLRSVREGQNLTTASSLIGKRVDAVDDSGNALQGVVDRVTIEVRQDDDSARSLKVRIGEHSIDLQNIRGIIGEDD